MSFIILQTRLGLFLWWGGWAVEERTEVDISIAVHLSQCAGLQGSKRLHLSWEEVFSHMSRGVGAGRGACAAILPASRHTVRTSQRRPPSQAPRTFVPHSSRGRRSAVGPGEDCPPGVQTAAFFLRPHVSIPIRAPIPSWGLHPHGPSPPNTVTLGLALRGTHALVP